MANVFKKAALSFGRWTGLYREPEVAGSTSATDAQMVLIEPVAEAMAEEGKPAIDEMIDAHLAEQGLNADTLVGAAAGDGSSTIWDGPSVNETASAAPVAVIPLDTEAAVVVGQVAEVAPVVETASLNKDIEAQAVGLVETPAVVVAAVEPAAAPVVAGVTVTEEAPAPVVAAVTDEVKPPVEMKPEPVTETIRTPKPSVSFTQLYELISTEVNKRTDSTVAVYERLLAATREELDSTRRNNRIAWSVGGVMTAVAAFGAIWSAGEVASTRGEIGGLKQQVSAAQQFAAEREALRTEILKISQNNAKMEIQALKSRLDEALAVSADRDRLRGEVETLKKANQEALSELRIARTAAATTQPVSDARPVNEKVIQAAERTAASITGKAAGSERQDVWSVLLNGKSEE